MKCMFVGQRFCVRFLKWGQHFEVRNRYTAVKSVGVVVGIFNLFYCFQSVKVTSAGETSNASFLSTAGVAATAFFVRQ